MELLLFWNFIHWNVLTQLNILRLRELERVRDRLWEKPFIGLVSHWPRYPRKGKTPPKLPLGFAGGKRHVTLHRSGKFAPLLGYDKLHLAA